MLKNLLNKFKLSAEWVELLWKIITLIFVLLGTTVTALWARASKEINQLGSFTWVIVAIISALIFTLMVYLISLSKKKNAEATKLSIEANYLATLATPKSTINPLSDLFTDQIINLSDLYLPTMQVQKNKVFKRCKIVGPGCIAIIGGKYINTHFIGHGSVLLLPKNASIVGVLGLQDCTIEDCEIIDITMLISYPSKDAMESLGIHIPGIKDYFPQVIIDNNSSNRVP
ncbi:hypothetical protein [Acinetobacter sp. LMB-5]|uniref:hypothetical protein n=1 Tax=Acinetobacter sp. LMB-5 TaxID=1609919 RepID=UPI0007616469|nr:hypothetical protein [Acinetobacter sp. LMB-5]